MRKLLSLLRDIGTAIAVGLALLALSCRTDAQVFQCAPKTLVSPSGTGTPYRYVLTPQGECEVWWCTVPPPSASAPQVPHWNIDRRCALHKYAGANAIDPAAIVRRIATHASGVLVAINEEAVRLAVKPASDQERYEYALLRWDACEDARANVALMIQPAASAPVLAADWCGAKPQPPAPPPPPPAPTVSYVVTSTAVYPLRADGTRATLALPQRATLGQPCDCTKRQILGLYGSRYCDVTIPGVTQPVVAGCTAK